MATIVTGTSLLLDDIAARALTRDDIAMTYGILLGRNDVDWHRCNRAIVDRWSVSALEYIKRKAWKFAQGGGR